MVDGKQHYWGGNNKSASKKNEYMMYCAMWERDCVAEGLRGESCGVELLKGDTDSMLDRNGG